MLLIAGVGYSHLGDLSFGPHIVERLRALLWPDDVVVEDFSYGPISILHWFEECPGGRFERAVFVGAMERGRTPGTLVSYEWIPRPLDPDDVQARVAEAVTGVISLDNLLIIAQHFDLLPRETTVIEMEPVDTEFGLALSQAGQECLEEATTWIRHAIRDRATTAGNGRHEEVSAR